MNMRIILAVLIKIHAHLLQMFRYLLDNKFHKRLDDIRSMLTNDHDDFTINTSGLLIFGD